MPFTKKQLAEFAHEELNKRRDFYPKWVKLGKMKQAQADERIEAMQVLYRLALQSDDALIARIQA
jgi:hypothetical protein